MSLGSRALAPPKGCRSVTYVPRQLCYPCPRTAPGRWLTTRCSGPVSTVAAPCSPRDGVLAGAEWASCLPLSSIVRHRKRHRGLSEHSRHCCRNDQRSDLLTHWLRGVEFGVAA